MTVPSLRRVHRSLLVLGALTLSSGLLPAAATAHFPERGQAAGAEGRALARAERLQAREERRKQRQLRREERSGAGSGSSGCSLTIGIASQRIVIGEDADISGTLTCPEGEEAGGRLVTVHGTGTRAGHVALATATTESDGNYELTVAGLERNTVISVRDGRTRSARLAIKVAPTVTISETAAAGQTASRRAGALHPEAPRETFTGTVDARFAGRRVALQSSYDPAGEQWRTIAVGRVGEVGDYSVTHSFRTPGQVWVRAVVHTPLGNVAGISEALAYDAVPTQNPNLTIESSTPLADFGQTVTIHGVAAGPAQTVALLLLGRGGSTKTVAEASTDEAGEYAFPIVAQQTGYYEARDASASSIALPVHVGFQLTWTAPEAAASAGQPVTVAGTLAPAVASELVQLEQQYGSGSGFHPIATGTVEGSSFSLVHTFVAAGSYRLRVRALARAGVEATASAPFTVQVKPAAA